MDLTIITNKRCCPAWHGVPQRILTSTWGNRFPSSRSFACWRLMPDFLWQKERPSFNKWLIWACPLPQYGTSLENSPYSRAPHGFDWGLWCNCIWVQILPLPNLLLSDPWRWCCQEGSLVNFFSCNSLSFRVCFLENSRKEGWYKEESKHHPPYS